MPLHLLDTDHMSVLERGGATALALTLRLSALADTDIVKRQKINIGTPDLKIAAIALANNAIVLTQNTRHFGKISNLRIADWTQGV